MPGPLTDPVAVSQGMVGLGVVGPEQSISSIARLRDRTVVQGRDLSGALRRLMLEVSLDVPDGVRRETVATDPEGQAQQRRTRPAARRIGLAAGPCSPCSVRSPRRGGWSASMLE